MNVRSPCINLCRMDRLHGHCEGCYRTLDEIARWAGADDDERRHILHRVARRRAAAEPIERDLGCDCER